MKKFDYPYFENDKCEYFPCHKKEKEYFNCFFCYCPLYALGDECGGNFIYIKDGIKDCSNCTIPHTKDGAEHIQSKTRAVSELAKNNRHNQK